MCSNFQVNILISYWSRAVFLGTVFLFWFFFDHLVCLHVSIGCFSPIKHEQIVGLRSNFPFGWYLWNPLKVTQGQGQKVKGQCQCQTCNFVKNLFGYIPWTNDWIWMILAHMIDINEMLKLTLGQGHKVKGQGQICSFVKTLFWLYIMNQLLDMDDTYTHDWYK